MIQVPPVIIQAPIRRTEGTQCQDMMESMIYWPLAKYRLCGRSTLDLASEA